MWSNSLPSVLFIWSGDLLHTLYGHLYLYVVNYLFFSLSGFFLCCSFSYVCVLNVSFVVVIVLCMYVLCVVLL